MTNVRVDLCLSLVLGPLTPAAGGRGRGCVCPIRVYQGLYLPGAAGAEGRAAGTARSAAARRGARGRDAGLRGANPLRRRAPALPQPPLLFINNSSLLNQQQVSVAPEERSHPGFVSLSSIYLKDYGYIDRWVGGWFICAEPRFMASRRAGGRRGRWLCRCIYMWGRIKKKKK